jgi:hypothetical protein
MSQRRVRFAFEILKGPNAGLRSGGWRVWTNNEDTYIAASTFGGVWKGSLHGDVAWRWAMDKRHVQSGLAPTVPSGHDRAPWVWEPTPFANGVRLAFAIAVTRGAMLDRPADPKNQHRIVVEDRWDLLTLAKIWMTEPGVDLPIESLIEEPMQLSSGRRVWITAGWEELEGGEAEPRCAGAIVEPYTPGVQDVRAPGLLVRGLRWDSSTTAA